MKLKIKHFDVKVFEKIFEPFKDINFSLFVDDIPQSFDELSDINILVLQEPNEYFGLHDWAIQNQSQFHAILTWDDKVLNNCENSMLLPFGHTWFLPEQYNQNYKKELKITHLCGSLNKTYGHSLRHELLARKNEIQMPTKFFDTYGDRHNLDDARKCKVEVFSDGMFGVAIENTHHRNYFTEKILDLFLLKSIPIYWGCNNIGDYFNPKGIIKVNSVDDIIWAANNINEGLYENCKEAIEENWNTAKDFVYYEQNIFNEVKGIFKFNNII